MAGYRDDNGKYVSGIEDFIPREQFESDDYRRAVVQDIGKQWPQLSQASKFHAIFATSSIPEAAEYYRLFKELLPSIKVTALFDPNTTEGEGKAAKLVTLEEILTDYNDRYDQNFTIGSHSQFKKDVAARLAHKKPYERIEKDKDGQIDLLIVVDQMLTGFDSKWINTLYLDKLIKYEAIIQAFSRTNRVFEADKRFGTIRYYRYPATMERNVANAVELYSGNKPLGLFVDKLPGNLQKMVETFNEIRNVFEDANVEGFVQLPPGKPERQKFAQLFSQFNRHLEAAKVQGFVWSQEVYSGEDWEISVNFTLDEFQILGLRYKELAEDKAASQPGEAPYDIETHLTEIETGRIDADYLNSKFEKFLKQLEPKDVSDEELDALLHDLHGHFAMLSREDQVIADRLLREIRYGEAELVPGKTFQDYLNDYKHSETLDEIQILVDAFGIEKTLLEELLDEGITQERDLNEFGRFDKLKATVNRKMVVDYYAKQEGKEIKGFAVSRKIDQVLRRYILDGVLEIGQESGVEEKPL